MEKKRNCAYKFLAHACCQYINKIMGKSSGNPPKNKRNITYKISKSRSLEKNFDGYLQNLIKSQPTITYKQCAPLLHKFVTKCIHTLNQYTADDLCQSANKIKICKSCNKWILSKQQSIQCHLCEDNYHIDCLKDQDNINEFKQKKNCSSCREIKQELKQRKKKLEQIRQQCMKCGIQKKLKTKNKRSKLLQCLKCIRLFHMGCFGSQKGVCSECQTLIRQKLLEIKEKLHVFDKKQLTLKQSFKKGKKNTKKQSSYYQKDQEDTRNTVFTSRLLKCNYPTLTPAEIQKYKSQLLFAIYAKNMEYTEQLQPINCCIESKFQESIDFGLAYLGPSDLKIYKKYKEQPIGPFLIEYKQGMGYDVIADRDLPKGMLVCQYVGDVYSHRQSLSMDDNDSRMELRKGTHADQNLFIIPHKFTNIARFINSLKQQDQHKLNMCSAKCYVKDKPAVLLFTTKEIKKGQSLFYDYNAGGAVEGYDTSYYQ